MTLQEIYQREKSKPKNFVREICEVTAKTEVTVYRWLNGKVEPDELTKRVLAQHFNTTPDELFKSAK